ncbi:hypothetical protein [Rhodococcus rhodochrous]|uniref:Uncharacterized protein n=1 Tax=Rhodococcus rhodochrous KG-21 TaxID=1441923 RepID=A0A0M8PPW9_RHORH|nr:hypothetical protein [Rhodococcus rhodochrous]KOS56148.1 hypothetical protein Z051_11085 [Rhodococcus rhodochrous KG-21]
MIEPDPGESVVSTADLHRLTRRREEHPAWALLRSDNAAAALALLEQKRIPWPYVVERLTRMSEAQP